MAAGVMPEIRDALPIVSGLASVNLATTSFDKPEILLKSISTGNRVFLLYTVHTINTRGESLFAAHLQPFLNAVLHARYKCA